MLSKYTAQIPLSLRWVVELQREKDHTHFISSRRDTMGQWRQEHFYFSRCKPKDKKRMYFIALFSPWDTPRKYYSVLIFLRRENCTFCLQPDPIQKTQPYFFPVRQLNYISDEKVNIIWPRTQSFWQPCPKLRITKVVDILQWLGNLFFGGNCL